MFTNEAYQAFLAENKTIKEETVLSSPPFYAPPIPKGYKTSAFQSGSTYIPKLSIFSGGPARSDVAYEVWKYEVECLMREGYSDRLYFRLLGDLSKHRLAKCDLEQMLHSVKS